MDPTAHGVVAVIPCIDLDASERWWNKLGFTRPADQPFDVYRMLSDGEGGRVHLVPATEGWLLPGRNPFGVYLYSPRVAALANAVPDSVIGFSRQPEHKPWGMYEIALDGPDGLLVRIGWPSRPPEGEPSL